MRDRLNEVLAESLRSSAPPPPDLPWLALHAAAAIGPVLGPGLTRQLEQLHLSTQNIAGLLTFQNALESASAPLCHRLAADCQRETLRTSTFD